MTHQSSSFSMPLLAWLIFGNWLFVGCSESTVRSVDQPLFAVETWLGTWVGEQPEHAMRKANGEPILIRGKAATVKGSTYTFTIDADGTAHLHQAFADGRTMTFAGKWRGQLDENQSSDGDKDLLRALHKTIEDVTSGVESFGFNAAIAKLYGFTATLTKSKAGYAAQHEAIMTLAQLMAPMTPHLAEAIWAHQGGQGLIANAPWPKVDPSLLVEDEVTLPIQINGKRRDEVTVAKDMSKDELEALVLQNKAVVKALDGATPRKLIIVPGRIVNVVI